jgi:hypothetical protein
MLYWVGSVVENITGARMKSACMILFLVAGWASKSRFSQRLRVDLLYLFNLRGNSK